MPDPPDAKHRPNTPAPPRQVVPAGGRPCAEYVELDVTSNFSFLRGASHPDELVYRAAELGYGAIGITDLNSLAGIVRAHQAAQQAEMKLIVGTRLRFVDAPDLLVWPSDRPAYARLCRLLTEGKRRAEKGKCTLALADFLRHGEGQLAALVPPRQAMDESFRPLRALRDALGDRLSLAISRLYGGADRERVAQSVLASQAYRVPLLATNHVHYHDPSRRALQDVLTCIRHTCSIEEAGYRLFPNGERYLKSPGQMRHLFHDLPQALKRTLEVAERCTFSLDELRYEYPDELVPAGRTPLEHLSHLAWRGAESRYPGGIPEKVRSLIEHELQLIARLRYEAYFLTVHDLVVFARSRGILCQGRGSAANSAVCYCLGITSVDPARIDLLFERFVSAARNEPPDIDVDFEHERREEVLQYLYNKYGRQRAGMTAEVITYRGRSAVRDVGKALGLSLDLVDQMAKRLDGWNAGTLPDEQLRQLGLDPADRTIRQVTALTAQLLGFPRHLSQHVGGMVMTRSPLCEMVPIENASMPDRTVIEWDKDDIDAVGILKVDVLALGMLTAISKAFRLVEWSGKESRDEETERRRDEVGNHEATKAGNGQSEHLSRTGGMAAGNGIGQSDVSCDIPDAQERAVWSDAPDAPGSRFDSIQHRRRIRAAEPSGPAEILKDRARISKRTGDPVRVGPPSGTAENVARSVGPDQGGGSHSPGAHPQPRESQTATSSLRLSVSPSLPSLRRPPLQLHTIPPEDPAVYDMICDADTVGVFQIESRAQMSMLPRLRPRCFYDLVIEVAIVRPGPIQGDMVHPYLRRRCGEEAVSYPSEALRQVLEKTLGVPLFQEQAMKVAMVGAGFSGEEADRLRRAMAAWRKGGEIDKFHRKIVQGMIRNGYERDFAEQCFHQIKGFGEYGFPESHAASFALLVYVSAWLKRYHPAAFAAALLNSQPMGFYAPGQLVRDAEEHGVTILPPDINASAWDCTLEGTGEEREPRPLPVQQRRVRQRADWGCDGPALRLGFRLIKHFRQAHAERIVAARAQHGAFGSIEQFRRLTRLPAGALRTLAEADAFGSIALSRRQALWQALAMNDAPAPLFEPEDASIAPADAANAPPAALPVMPLKQEVMADYATAGLSLKRHPVSLVRDELSRRNVLSAEAMHRRPHGTWVKVAGLVLIRQRPGTASGIVFATIEDETGIVNLILTPDVYDRYRLPARHAALLQADGYLERHGQVVHVLAKRLHRLDELLWRNDHHFKSRDFH